MSTETRVQYIKGLILRGVDYFNGVKLPKPQTTGTGYQKSTYAELKARELVNQGI